MSFKKAGLSLLGLFSYPLGGLATKISENSDFLVSKMPISVVV
jgi:hypothetical protein